MGGIHQRNDFTHIMHLLTHQLVQRWVITHRTDTLVNYGTYVSHLQRNDFTHNALANSTISTEMGNYSQN
jgi:tRNA A-37 threonylcarbamoyl transferase component Bud32